MKKQIKGTVMRRAMVGWVVFCLFAVLAFAPVAQATTLDVRDGFDQVTYANNDGTAMWRNDWKESDSRGGGASAGHVRIKNSELQMKNRATR